MSRRRKALSDIGVAGLRPRDKRYTYGDPELRGHYVRVLPSGVKSYAAVARHPSGKQIWVTVGAVHTMPIVDARDRARAALQRIRDGLPVFDAPPPKAITFKEVAESWLKRHVQAKKLRSAVEIERCLKVYVYPDWETRPFAGIRRTDVTQLLDKLEVERGARQADAVLAIVRAIANWHAARHDDYASPFTHGMKRLAPVKRYRVLSDDEVRAIWAQAERAGSFGAIIRIALLTAQRREKVAEMRWDSLRGNVWTIPADARERGTGGTLRLSPAALGIIEHQPKLNDNPFVFAGRGRAAFNGFSKCKAAFDQSLPKFAGPAGTRVEIPNWTLHDLRRTARSLMSRAGVRPDIAERVLGHVIAGVEGIYDRHRYEEEKADTLIKLAGLIDSILTSARPH